MTICRRALIAFPVQLAFLLCSAANAFSQVRGVYSPGSTLTGAGTVASPGFSYSNQLWYGASSVLKGPQGDSLPLEVSLSLWIDNNNLVYVPKFKLLGATPEFTVDIAFSNDRFFGPTLLSAGSNGRVPAAGLTNTNFVPFDLGWHFKWADVQTGYSVTAPTGRYVPGALSNVSNGYWTNAWQAGATIYLTKNKATQISLFNTYAWNTTQQGTGIHPGQNDSLDYSLSQTFPLSKNGKWSLLVGAAGYGQWQTTRNGGQNQVREALKYSVDAAGFTLNLSSPFRGFFVGTSVLWEYAARNTFQGRTMTVTGGFQF